MSETLKPCPFCGGEAVTHERNYGHRWNEYMVYCVACDASTAEHTTVAAAVAAWNRRAPEPVPVGCLLTPLPDIAEGHEV